MWLNTFLFCTKDTIVDVHLIERLTQLLDRDSKGSLHWDTRRTKSTKRYCCWKGLLILWWRTDKGSSSTSRLMEGLQVLCAYRSCLAVFVTAWGGKDSPVWRAALKITAMLRSDPLQADRVADRARNSLPLARSPSPLAQGCVVSAPWVSKENCGPLWHSLVEMISHWPGWSAFSGWKLHCPV